MSFLDIMMIAVGLAMDACVVSAGAGASGRSSGHRASFRLGFHFGLFQFFMPVVGWFGGSVVAGALAAVDHWIAFAVLAFVGVRMMRGEVGSGADDRPGDPSRGWSLVLLSIATSIDALAVGFSLAMIGVEIWYPAVVIGLVTAAMSVAGLHLGARLGKRFGSRMEVIGGIILILVGLHIVVEHLAS